MLGIPSFAAEKGPSTHLLGLAKMSFTGGSDPKSLCLCCCFSPLTNPNKSRKASEPLPGDEL